MARQQQETRSQQTESTESSWTTTSGRTGETAAAAVEPSQGHTTIAAAVVQKIAGASAQEINGVYAIGGGVARTFGAIRERIPGASASQTSGVSVEVGEKQAAIDLEIVVEYGTALVDLSRAVRRNVTTSIERMTGLDVVEVNITVNDVQLPGEEEQSAAATRVE